MDILFRPGRRKEEKHTAFSKNRIWSSHVLSHHGNRVSLWTFHFYFSLQIVKIHDLPKWRLMIDWRRRWLFLYWEIERHICNMRHIGKMETRILSSWFHILPANQVASLKEMRREENETRSIYFLPISTRISGRIVPEKMPRWTDYMGVWLIGLYHGITRPNPLSTVIKDTSNQFN
jgi:hypothetical protein